MIVYSLPQKFQSYLSAYFSGLNDALWENDCFDDHVHWSPEMPAWESQEAEPHSHSKKQANQTFQAGREIPIIHDVSGKTSRTFDAQKAFDADGDDLIASSSDEDTDDNVSEDTQALARFLNLTSSDMQELRNGDMLSDKHVYAAQKLLQVQYPHVAGLQDSCLSQTRFNSIDAAGDVIQIHHTRGNHWVVSAAIDGVVYVYDTLYDSLSDDLRRQLREIYGRHFCNDAGKLVVLLPSVRHQRGSADCGLFAIAIALELCQGHDPTNIAFRQKQMRRHLDQCFLHGRLTSFPQTFDAESRGRSQVDLIDCVVQIT